MSDPAGAFNSSIVGDAIAVQGAGASGAALVTTITGVTSASQLTLGTAASTSISGSAVYTYGVSKEGTTGTTTASSSAISCSTTGTIPASCDFTDTNAHFASSDLNKAITIYGAGPAASPLTTSIIKVNSATSVELGFEASTAIAGTAGYTYGTLLQGSTGTATAASKTFTDSNASFVSGNVGDDIVITGAGPSGASLVTTIAAVNSATSVTLGTAASTSVSGSALYAYGTPTQGTISGSFTVPTGLTCGTSCNVYIDEPDTTLTNGNYSGSGSYNVGLRVQPRQRRRRIDHRFLLDGLWWNQSDPADGHQCQPDQRPPGRGHPGHGHRHRVRLGLDQRRLRLRPGHLGQRDQLDHPHGQLTVGDRDGRRHSDHCRRHLGDRRE